MNKKFLKRIVAFAMATTMVFGSSAIAFAAEDANLTGQSTYEGVVADAQYETITLPTAAKDQFDFVADPNELINKFASGGGANFEFTGTDTGVYFASRSGSKLILSSDSNPLEVKNKNYHDSDITVELDVTSAGSNSPAFASSSAWSSVTAKELYLAVVGGSKDVSKTDYLDTGKKAKISFTVSGCPSNYFTSSSSTEDESAAFGESRSYFVTSKAANDIDDSLWVTGGFHLTGAINKNEGVEWGAGFTMPTIKVTWTIGKHTDGIAANKVVLSGSDIYVKLTAAGNAVTSKISSATVNGTAKTAVSDSGIVKIAGGAPSAGTYNVVVVYDGETYIGSVTKS